MAEKRVKGNYRYYQPNKMDLKDRYGDCTIRALSKAMNVSWVEAFDIETPICREYQASGVFDMPVKQRVEAMAKLGFTYHPVSNKRGSRRPTVESFSKDHKEGTHIAMLAHHVVAVVDGLYYDTWDCGYKSLYGWFTLEK